MIYQLDDVTPEIGTDCWVAPTAVLVGDIVLGPSCSVWFGAVLRGDNEQIKVGQGSNIQENAVLHTDMGFPLIIGAGCTIGHKALLHGCILGENTLIGMGATVLNGARIGKNCLIGAGALVLEGQEVPDGSLLVGSPAKVVRQLDAQSIEQLRASALHYQENMQRFQRGLSLKDQG